MSGGNNHYQGCPCPWCYHPSYTVAKPINFQTARVESYTVPNARCPKCGDPVFFYRSPFGGAVYFDALGIPWPKHPCMDSGRLPRQFSASDDVEFLKNRKSPTWQVEGWMPIAILFVSKPSNAGGQTIWVREVIGDYQYLLETSGVSDEIKDVPAFLKKHPDGKWIVETPLGTFSATPQKHNFGANWRERIRSRIARLEKDKPEPKNPTN